MKNNKIQELEKRTILLLEKTKKEYKKFAEERKRLYCYLINKNEIPEWEKYVCQLEELIEVEKYDKEKGGL